MWVGAAITTVGGFVHLPRWPRSPRAPEIVVDRLISRAVMVVLPVPANPVKTAPAPGWFPLKMKDEIVGNAFGYLRSKGLLVDDDEDDGIDMAALGGME